MAASGQVSRKGGRDGGRRAGLLCYVVVEAFVALCPATVTRVNNNIVLAPPLVCTLKEERVEKGRRGDWT